MRVVFHKFNNKYVSNARVGTVEWNQNACIFLKFQNPKIGGEK